MANFQGKNGQNIKKQFFERLRYSVLGNVAEPDSSSNAVKDFGFAERPLYGRINKTHEIITVNPGNLTTIKSRKNPRKKIKAINFVSDAFEGLVLETNKAAFSGKLDSQDSYLYKLEAHKGFIDPINNFKLYNEKISNIFIETYLNEKRREQINDFSSFFNLFSSFLLEISNSVPITLNSFITSGFCNLLNTGLTIHVADLDASDDSAKEDFINSPNFSFFKLAAEKHGFSITKNVPWVLVADIASPAMHRYSTRYGFNDDQIILAGYFLKTYERDIQNLQKLSYITYNKFIARSPQNVIVSGLATRSRTCRAPISTQEFDRKYPDKNWVDMYIDIRYIEQGSPGSAASLNEIKRNARDIQSVNGTTAMQSYVNFSIRGFDNYNGSFAKAVEKINFTNTRTKTKPTY